MSTEPARGSGWEVRGRVCVVTGATGGIGLATATALAGLGATVLLVGRDAQRGAVARDAVRRATGSERVELHLADLASQRQVRALAERLAGAHDRVHVLVNNAAVYTRRRALSEDGIELQLAVNHLAPYLLTRLLLPRLQEAGGARIVTVSSEAHRWATMRWDDLQGERGYLGVRAYAQSKLANLLFTRALARRLDPARVTANAAHPGVVGTPLLFGGWAPLRLLRRWMRTPEEGARAPVLLASAPELAEVTGLYFRDDRPIEPSRAARDEAAAERLWEVSARLTGLA